MFVTLGELEQIGGGCQSAGNYI